MKYIIIIAVSLLLLSCNAIVSFTPEEGLVGEWSAKFEQVYYPQYMAEGDSVQYKVQHESLLSFDGTNFRFKITPAVPFTIGEGLYDSIFVGKYNVDDDLLTLTNINGTRQIESYAFEIRGKTLRLSYIPMINVHDDQIIEVPLQGGVPWGHAFMRHSGEFRRAEMLE